MTCDITSSFHAMTERRFGHRDIVFETDTANNQTDCQIDLQCHYSEL